jgi:hypothetical protein
VGDSDAQSGIGHPLEQAVVVPAALTQASPPEIEGEAGDEEKSDRPGRNLHGRGRIRFQNVAEPGEGLVQGVDGAQLDFPRFGVDSRQGHGLARREPVKQEWARVDLATMGQGAKKEPAGPQGGHAEEAALEGKGGGQLVAGGQPPAPMTHAAAQGVLGFDEEPGRHDGI